MSTSESSPADPSPAVATTSAPLRAPGPGPGRLARLAPKLTAEQVEARLRVLQAATVANNTKRSYSSAVQQFLAWGGLLPTDEDTVLRYLATHAGTLNHRTLAHRLAALAKWHQQQGFADPTSTPAVRAALAGMARLFGQPKKKAKALPLAGLRRIVEQLVTENSLTGARDNALLQVGYLAAFRSSELVGIDVADLVWEPEGVTVVLNRSKTDQEGEGIVKAIPYGDNAPLCGPTALRAWLDLSGITSGPVFRPLTRHGTIRANALAAGSVTTILVHRAHQAGLPYTNELSSHSLRRGLATEAERNGASRAAIKRQGGWKTDAVVDGYIEEAQRFEDNAAGVLSRKR